MSCTAVRARWSRCWPTSEFGLSLVEACAAKRNCIMVPKKYTLTATADLHRKRETLVSDWIVRTNQLWTTGIERISLANRERLGTVNADQPTIAMGHMCRSSHEGAWSTLEPHPWMPEEGFGSEMWNQPSEESRSLQRLMLQVLQVPGAVCRIWHENGHEDVLWWFQVSAGIWIITTVCEKAAIWYARIKN